MQLQRRSCKFKSLLLSFEDEEEKDGRGGAAPARGRATATRHEVTATFYEALVVPPQPSLGPQAKPPRLGLRAGYELPEEVCIYRGSNRGP